MTLSHKIKWTCIYLAISLCLAMFVYGAYLRCRDSQDYCIITRPWVGVSGYIAHPGIFEGGGTRYRISYRGTTKVSGEACLSPSWVTKSETSG